MFIIVSYSRVTRIQTYYRGIVTETRPNKYSASNDWSVDRAFATRFLTHALARKVAETFTTRDYTIDFLVIEEGHEYV